MRIRLPFAGAFATLLLLSAYLGLSPSTESPTLPLNDKAAHALTFLLLTTTFYWVLDTTRRRILNFTLSVCTLGLGVGSEILQAVLPNGRSFDFYGVVANIVGSLAGVGLCSWYHKRMLERRRTRKYTAVPNGDGAEGGEEDLELGEGPGIGGGEEHEEGVTSTSAGPSTTAAGGSAGTGTGQKAMTLEDEVDNWDENAVDAWDEDDAGDVGVSAPSASRVSVDAKKRAD